MFGIDDALIIGGAATLGSAIIGKSASDKAANAQERAANEASATQRYMFDRSVALNEPWRAAGEDALSKLRPMIFGHTDGRRYTMADMALDPGYQFRLGEGQKALERSAAARGGLLSGRTGKDLLRYGQDYASNEFGNLFNRYAAVSGIGQTAATGMGNAGIATGNNIAANTIGAGNARASGYVGGANAIAGAAGQGLSFFQSQQLINQLNRRPYTVADYPLVQASVPGQFNLDTYG